MPAPDGGCEAFKDPRKQGWSGSITHTEYATEVRKSLEQLHNRLKGGSIGRRDLWVLGIDEFFDPVYEMFRRRPIKCSAYLLRSPCRIDNSLARVFHTFHILQEGIVRLSDCSEGFAGLKPNDIK